MPEFEYKGKTAKGADVYDEDLDSDTTENRTIITGDKYQFQ